jgi:small conductance mechanosensitive channel
MTHSADTGFWPTFATQLVAVGWTLANVAAYILGAFVLAWILRAIIKRIVSQIVNGVKKNQRVDETQALAASPLAAVRLVQRTRTLGTVLSNIVNVVVGIIALVLILDLLAPKAIGSLAILTAAIGAGLGFGAQNIVKDVFNGLFMVMEDQLGVGDIVDVQLATGVVEAVGIRVTQVRDVNGVLWFVRNGEILRVGNVSQGWSRVIVDLAVPYETDVDDIQQRMLATANALASDPKWRARIVEKPELWGLQSVSADAIVLRIVLKSRSTYRDDVSRELRTRLKKTTDEMGITLPSLTSVVLSGFDDITSIGGMHTPRTNPLPIANPPKGRRARKRVVKAQIDDAPEAAATSAPPAKPTRVTQSRVSRAADPHAIPIVDPRLPLDEQQKTPRKTRPAAGETTDREQPSDPEPHAE